MPFPRGRRRDERPKLRRIAVMLPPDVRAKLADAAAAAELPDALIARRVIEAYLPAYLERERKRAARHRP